MPCASIFLILNVPQLCPFCVVCRAAFRKVTLQASISLCHCSADSNLDSSLRLHTPDRYFHHRTIHWRNVPNCANTASHPSSRSPSRTTIHQASLPQRPPQVQQTNRCVRQEKNSLLGHAAIQRIQGQKQDKTMRLLSSPRCVQIIFHTHIQQQLPIHLKLLSNQFMNSLHVHYAATL